MRVEVDPRVELVSVLFHLARTPGYSRAFDTPYRRAVAQHFSPHVDHPALAVTADLRSLHGISYNAPVGLAVFLDDHFEARVDVAGVIPELDPRWSEVAIDDYLAVVRDFAAATKFGAFFEGQRDYVTSVENRLTGAIEGEDLVEWIEATLGPRQKSEFALAPGLLTGPYSYEASARDDAGRERVTLVIGFEEIDDDELPVTTSATVDVVVHEMAHAYVNPVVARRADAFTNAPKLFEQARVAMAEINCGSASDMVVESLVRAVVILFIGDRRGDNWSEIAVRRAELRGFRWMAGLVDCLGRLREDAAAPIDLEASVEVLAKAFRSG